VTEPAVSTPGTSEFGVVLRGYDRGQVDEHLRVLAEHLAELRIAHQRERRRAESAEGQLHRARTDLERSAAAGGEAGESVSAPGFGYRVEKLLRAAEDEACEVRAVGAREATALLDRARGEAEARRHEMEQSLIARGAASDQQAAQRMVRLDERERRVAERAAAARDEAEQMLTQARHQCDQLWLQARTRAERERAAAQDAILQRRRAAEQELGRLHRLHDQMRGQLARLLDSLAGEFSATNPVPSAPPQPDSPTPPDSRPQPDSLTPPVRVPPHPPLSGPEAPPDPQPYPRSRRDGPVPYQKNTDQALTGSGWFDMFPSEALTNNDLMK
jgi:cell division septum initiation protein DivIVA